ncbi:TPA: LysB family phage lysis regulatory protein [Escherichia coli]|uniref:Rz-like lysis system protein LysB n=2 Tax=Escherichia coli TaxID=562 RepID=UPI000BE13DA3|nr:Rz-like lysis system protein LysB [Escherichia coli]EEW7597008.1 LysB family phage lysis regulatory protein [Escherichia coli]EFA6417233.1 LysB family phage lysis regulatory protein [Escherichia coli]EFB2452351.1 LysB family phage lysis regulatory protein [Escherichia coli]EFD0491120.1 LysB family phage lysis regulatory protein [Escherichia coli]EFN8798987.1 LysB family phage lysis regulatory protein [Escherichia coli]
MSRFIVILLAGLLAVVLWLRHDNANLSRSFEKANRVASEQKTTIGMLKNQLAVSQRITRTNEAAQVRLSDELSAAGELAARREHTITRLLNENEDLRRWYSADLPDAVRRLHTRTSCVSAAHCLQRLPEGEPLPNAGKRAHD